MRQAFKAIKVIILRTNPRCSLGICTYTGIGEYVTWNGYPAYDNFKKSHFEETHLRALGNIYKELRGGEASLSVERARAGKLCRMGDRPKSVFV